MLVVDYAPFWNTDTAQLFSQNNLQGFASYVFSWYVSHPIFVSPTPFHDLLGVLNGWLAHDVALELFMIIEEHFVFYNEIVDIDVETIWNYYLER